MAKEKLLKYIFVIVSFWFYYLLNSSRRYTDQNNIDF